MHTSSDNIFSHNFKIYPFSLFQLLLFLFILGAITLSYLEGLSKIVILHGVCFTFLYIIYILYTKRIVILPEVIIYFAWVFWSIGGAVNAANKEAYIQGLRTVIQISVMFFLISGLVSTRSNMFKIALIGLIIGGLIQSMFVCSTGELTTSIETINARVQGLSKNANSFAFQMLTVIFAVFYFLEKKANYIIRFLLLLTLLVSFIGIIYSGSRNGFLCFLVFLFWWYLFCKQKKLPKHPILVYIILIIIFLILYLSFTSLLEYTLIWKRFSAFDDNSSQTRLFLYKEGFEMISKKPIFGIGLNNFSESSKTGLYSHSDYIEVAANTGIIGFILYFSIYVILWFRLRRIKKNTVDAQLLQIIGVLKASILTILIFGIGKPHINSKLTWIYLSAVAGYTWQIEQFVKTQVSDKHWILRAVKEDIS